MNFEPKFFTKENNKYLAEEIKSVFPVNVNLNFDTVAPALTLAEKQYIVPVLGDDLYKELSDYYALNNHSNDLFDEVVKMLQYAIVRYALFYSFDQFAVMIRDNGMSDQQGENRLYRYQSDALRNSLSLQGADMINQIIQFLEKNIASFDSFKQSKYYTFVNDSLVKNTEEFNSVVNINNDSRIFQKLRTYITSVENMELKHYLGDALVKALKDNRNEDRFNAIVRDVQMFVCSSAMADAIPLMNLVPTDNGYMLASERSAGGGQTLTQPKNEILDRTLKNFKLTALNAIQKVVEYCKGHRDVFPEINDVAPIDHTTSNLLSRQPKDNQKLILMH